MKSGQMDFTGSAANDGDSFAGLNAALILNYRPAGTLESISNLPGVL